MRKVEPEEAARRMYAYTKTKNDSDAAAVLGISADTFRKWRVAMGLAAKAKAKPKGKEGQRTEHKVNLEEIRALLPR